MTLNQVQAQLREIATNHQQINTFGWGELPELGKSSDVVYPLMWVVQQPSKLGAGIITFRFKFVFADLALKDKGNEDEVLSDQVLTANDIALELNNPLYDWEFTDGNDLEPFYEDHDDIVTGWVGSYEITVGLDYGRCAIPQD